MKAEYSIKALASSRMNDSFLFKSRKASCIGAIYALWTVNMPGLNNDIKERSHMYSYRVQCVTEFYVLC